MPSVSQMLRRERTTTLVGTRFAKALDIVVTMALLVGSEPTLTHIDATRVTSSIPQKVGIVLRRINRSATLAVGHIRLGLWRMGVTYRSMGT